MAEDDIYGNKARFEKFCKELNNLTKKPKNGSKRKYYIKNKANIEYYKQLQKIYRARDTSYIRRLRLFRVLLIVTYVTDKDLKDLGREEIDNVVAFSHEVNKSVKSKSDFIKDLKFIWRQLFPETDHKGRPDETLIPYVVRHLKNKIDKSKEKMRNGRIEWEEYEKILGYFDNNPKIQSFLAIITDSLCRPQELVYRTIGDCTFDKDNDYATIALSSHGKEGVGFLQVVDSLSYFKKWFKQHPYKNDPNAFLFCNGDKYKPMSPETINKHLRKCCNDLGFNKTFTCYDFKRAGVTFYRRRGFSDLEVQHIARWTSTRQLSTYDQSIPEDVLKSRGKKKLKELPPVEKYCVCGVKVHSSMKVCPECDTILDRDDLKKAIEDQDEFVKFLIDNKKTFRQMFHEWKKSL